MKRKRASRWLPFLILLAGAGGAYYWLGKETEPMPNGPKHFVRWETSQPLETVFKQFQAEGVLRNATAARMVAYIRRTPNSVQRGTYEVGPGMTLDQILASLRTPIRQMVRIPETNWARRTANYLAKKQILKADEYLALVNNPSAFKNVVSFPLPSASLEGYLYPDTYDLPPLIGARAVIERQLKGFETKVWKPLNHPGNLQELVTKASLVELESGNDQDRAKIAGVIDNRLNKGMRLQIDAALLYGIQKWRRLTVADYKTIDSPYNLYKVDGLPPGPICSPTVKSIEAVLHPAKHNDVYYVAMPNGKSVFASTYAQHLHNVRERIKELKEQQTTE